MQGKALDYELENVLASVVAHCCLPRCNRLLSMSTDEVTELQMKIAKQGFHIPIQEACPTPPAGQSVALEGL